MITCPGCGALVPDIDGPTHRYLDAAPGCWQVYGDVLAKEYSDVAYNRVHRLTVDAYSLQHPGTPSPQTIRSANIHLIALCAAFEHGIAYDRIAPIMSRINTQHKDTFVWLEPPAALGAVTVLDVVAARDADEHQTLVHQWAESVWRAWSQHHQTAERYLEPVLASGTVT